MGKLGEIAKLKSPYVKLEIGQSSEPMIYKNWSDTFILLHPASFTEQNKFIINKIRRKYPVKKE